MGGGGKTNWSLWTLVALGIVALGAIVVFRFVGPPRDRPPVGASVDTKSQKAPEPPKLGPDDWAGFRGPDGSGAAPQAAIPLEWGDTKNLLWKADLPGPGSSSPIVVGDRVYVTCYSGYGTDVREPGDPRGLKRHLVCLSRDDGEPIWEKTVAATEPETPYRGYIAEHGYASATPVSDGENVYAFFGKSGVVAFDRDGNKLWQTSVGTRSDSRRWGSSGSPVLYGDLVVVNAASEARAVVALDRRTGREVWRAEANSTDLTFGTPAVVRLPDGRGEIVLAVPGEVWGINPDTGKLNWYASVRIGGNVSPSVVTRAGVVYATGGYQGSGTVAVRAGGRGDVTQSHVLWSVRPSSYVPSPVLYEGHLYWVDNAGKAVCLDAATGKDVFTERLPVEGSHPVYASVVLAGDKLVAVTRTHGAFVLSARPEFEILAHNTLADDSDFNASPVVSGDRLFLRSNRAVYCIGE